MVSLVILVWLVIDIIFCPRIVDKLFGTEEYEIAEAFMLLILFFPLFLVYSLYRISSKIWNRK